MQNQLNEFYEPALWIYAALTLATFIALFFIAAPYGRHTRTGWGPTIRADHAWFVMELVALVSVPALALYGTGDVTAPVIVLLLLWVFHYGHRALVYPWRQQSGNKRLPVLIPVMAVFYNLLNGYANGWNFAYNVDQYQDQWLYDPRFIIGCIVFAVGAWINLSADNTTLAFKKKNGGEYGIINTGLHRKVAAPNYLGEIIEWTGWAIATWSLGGLLFALYTIANLAPRARSNLLWYRRTFSDYPSDRKALIPYVW